MPKKSQKKDRKRSYGESNRVKYQEKMVTEWQCAVCNEKYDRTHNYCLSCLQSLYYYCYINNQMFVTHDDSYLGMYYTMPAEDLSSCSEGSEISEEDNEKGVNLEWVENLLA